jgi:hypothetical protein
VLSERGSDVICPKCGEPVRPDETLWSWNQKWYCSEGCVRNAMKG